MKTNQLLTSTGIALTLALTTSAFNVPANAQRQPEGGRYQRYQSKIVYICPQFNNIFDQIKEIAKSDNPDVALCSQPTGNPAPDKNVGQKTPKTLIPLPTASQSVESFKDTNQQGAKSQCGWLWVRGYGWVWVC